MVITLGVARTRATFARHFDRKAWRDALALREGDTNRQSNPVKREGRPRSPILISPRASDHHSCSPFSRGGRKSLDSPSNSRPTALVGLRPAARGLRRDPENYHLRGSISVPGDSRVSSCPLTAANPRNRSRAEKDSEAVGYLRLLGDVGAWKQLENLRWSRAIFAAEGLRAAATGSRLRRRCN